jgi:hypothetical protein
MPSVMTFDTLAYAKKLKAAGVPDEQAETGRGAKGYR